MIVTLGYIYILGCIFFTFMIFFFKLEDNKVVADFVLETEKEPENKVSHARVSAVCVLFILLWPFFVPVLIARTIKGKK